MNTPSTTNDEWQAAKDAYDFATAVNCGIDDRHLDPSKFCDDASDYLESAIFHLQDAVAKVKSQHSGWKIPTPLTPAGRRAAEIIRDYCSKHDLGPGERMFYTPEEWSERGEEYGTDSVLVVVHEACDAAIAISMDGAYYSNASYKHFGRLDQQLRSKGMYLEGMYSWCSAVYVDSDYQPKKKLTGKENS